MELIIKETHSITLGGVQFEYFKTDGGTNFPLAPILDALDQMISAAEDEVKNHKLLGEHVRIINETVCLPQDYFGAYLCLMDAKNFNERQFKQYIKIVKDFFRIYDPEIFPKDRGLYDIHKQIIAVQFVADYLKNIAGVMRGKLGSHYFELNITEASQKETK
jgi:hypothetical protein